MATASGTEGGALRTGHGRTETGRGGRRWWWSLLALILLAGAVAAVLVATSPAGPADQGSADDRVAAFISTQWRADNTPKAAFAVVRDGRVTVSGATGDGTSADTPFQIGSLSKSFTALAIMQLVDQRRIGLDDPVTKHIPWFRTADPSAVITIRHLLNQTSGLPTHAGTADLYTPETSLEDRVRAIADVRPVSRPGDRFEYCNKNYAALGLVVEKASGKTYGDYVRERIFAPLGMRNSFTDSGQARAAGLVDGSSVWFGANVSRPTPPYPGALPDGYLISTANDLARYLRAQLDGRSEGGRIVSEEGLRQLHQPGIGLGPDSPLPNSDGYGFGWGTGTVNGRPVVSHPGDLGAYHSDMALLPGQQTGLVVLTARNNVLSNPASAYAGALAILAGEPAPEVSRGFVHTYLVIDVIALVLLAAMLFSAIRLRRRVRVLPERIATKGTLRAVAIPGLAGILAAVVLYLAVFFGLGAAMASDGMMPLSMAWDSAPDLTILVLAVVGFLAVRGIAVLAFGLVARRRGTAAGAGE